MKLLALRRMLCAAVVTLVVVPPALVARDLTLGTWERNVRESKSSGPDPWARQIVVRSAVPGGVKQTVTAEMKDGTQRQLTFTMLYDGTPTKVEGAPPAWDTVVTRRIDDRTAIFETYDSRGGKYRVSGRSVVTKNGKRMTTHQKGTGVKGEPIEFMVVYDRVAPPDSKR